VPNCTVYEGHARFESSQELSVGSERLTADRIFINVGGRAVLPQMPDIEGVPYLTNSSIMDVDFLPRHLIIIGGGYIGLEFAQMYRRFGSEVTIIGRAPHLARDEDQDVSTSIREILEREVIKVRLNATCIGFSRRGEEILAHVDCASGDPEVSGSHVLLAVDAVQIPMTSDSPTQALPSTNAGTLSWMTSYAPASPGSGR
jgi:pyruvate/2-oxoglutarate dehydrogenase complex dihydrolipoamide dehydrogenase (E3) component